MYEPRPSPAILPSFAAQVSVALGPDSGAADAAALPAELQHAVAGRRAEFLAGRHCARAAIARFDGGGRGETAGRAADGAPIWPAGLTGSITHAAGFVSAAVARADHADGLGIDSERIVTADVASEIAALVAHPDELNRIMAATGLDRAASLSLCFSAKESLFKCLYPLARRFFDHADAELVRIGAAGGFVLCLRIALGADLPAGLAVPGRFVIDDVFVHTGIAFRRRADPAC